MAEELEQFTARRIEMMLLLENFSLGQEGATVATDSQQPDSSNVVANLLDPSMDTAWESADLLPLGTDQLLTVRYDLGSPRTINTVAPVGTNLRLPTKIKFYQNNPSLSPPIYDGPFTDPIMRAKFGDFSWLDLEWWTLGPDDDDLAFWGETSQLRSVFQSDVDYTGIRWVDIVMDANDAMTRPYQGDSVQIAGCFIAKSYQPSINMLLGWALGVDDTSTVHRTESGSARGRNREKLREFSFALDFLGKKGPHAGRVEAFKTIHTKFANRLGKLGYVFAWPEPKHPFFFYDTSMVCTAETLPRSVMVNYEWPGAIGWKLKETV